MFTVNPSSCCASCQTLLRKAISKPRGVPRPYYASEGSSWPPPPRHLLTKAAHAANRKLPRAPSELYILPVVVYGQQLLSFPRKRAMDRAVLLEEAKQNKKIQKNPPEKEVRSFEMTGKFLYMDILL